MVRYPALRKIVGTDALTAVTGTHLALSVRSNGVRLLLLRLLQHPGTEHPHCLFLVFQLGLLILALHHNACRQMGNADSGLCLVDILSACTAGTIGVNAQLLRLDIHIHLVSLRQDSHRHRRGMDAPP